MRITRHVQTQYYHTFMSIFHTLFSNKEFPLLAKQETNNQTCKTVRINMNSEVNISQSHVSSINIMWQRLGQKSCKKLHKNTQNTQINRKT